MINFALDAIDRALKDHLPTRLSLIANQAEENNAMAEADVEESKAEKKYPETIFSDAELCQIIRNFNLTFGSVPELIEVCLVSITATSWLLPNHRDVSMQLD